MIIAAVLKPAIDELLGEPLSPSPLGSHARVDLQNAKNDACREQRQVNHREKENRVRILLLQRVENPARPNVHAVRSRKVQKDGEQKESRQNPGQPRPAFAPKSGRVFPKSPQQMGLLRAFDMFRQPVRTLLLDFVRLSPAS